MKLTEKEEKIARLALDPGAKDGERASAAKKLIESLQARGVTVEDITKDKITYRRAPTPTPTPSPAPVYTEEPSGLEEYGVSRYPPAETWEQFFSRARRHSKTDLSNWLQGLNIRDRIVLYSLPLVAFIMIVVSILRAFGVN